MKHCDSDPDSSWTNGVAGGAGMDNRARTMACYINTLPVCVVQKKQGRGGKFHRELMFVMVMTDIRYGRMAATQKTHEDDDAGDALKVKGHNN